MTRKEKNCRAFEGMEMEICKIRDCWFHYFESLFLSNDMYKVKDFRYIVDILTEL